MSFLGMFGFALALLASIGLHELGHFLPARKFGVRVPQFMIGFGPTIWKRHKGETEFGIKAIPFGGYIRMIGMFLPSTKTDDEWNELGRIERVVEEARYAANVEVSDADAGRTFYSLSVPKKITVMFGGPFMNLVLATFFFSIVIVGIGRPDAVPTVTAISACVPTVANPDGIVSNDGSCGEGVKTAAATLGLQHGDKITSVNGHQITTWDEFGKAVQPIPGKEVALSYVRDGVTISKNVVIGSIAKSFIDGTTSATGDQGSYGFFGIQPQVVHVRGSFTEVFPFMRDMAASAVSGLSSFPSAVWQTASDMVTGKPRDINGPVSVIGIGKISGDIASAPNVTSADKISELLFLIGSVNLFLFLFNLVPIPPLDGGHIAGAIYEGIRKTVAKLRGKPNPGPADTARLMPITVVATTFLIAMSLITVIADLINPLSF